MTLASTAPDWIAVDWGTTNLRAWAMTEGGDRLAEGSSDQGMSKLAADGFEPALLDVIGDWLPEGQVTPVLAAGMVGARQGWVEAPYAPVPCAALSPDQIVRVPTQSPRVDMRILPGLCQTQPPDVMRGEETQIFGFLSTQPGFDGMICLPGTHSKWARVSGGTVRGFHTAMTGELFALLSEHSILRHSVGDGWDQDAFLAGASRGMAMPERLISTVFSIRAASLLQDVPAGGGRSHLSGLLIGSEIGAFLPETREIAIIGGGGLVRSYASALAAIEITPMTIDSGVASRKGLHAAFQTLTGDAP